MGESINLVNKAGVCLFTLSSASNGGHKKIVISSLQWIMKLGNKYYILINIFIGTHFKNEEKKNQEIILKKKKRNLFNNHLLLSQEDHSQMWMQF